MASITVSDGSLGDQGSCSTGGSKPKKSLDELLSSTRKNSGDFADMPRLESFRADDMSAVTSASFTSNSRAGDSRASVGDDNASLPSLSSFRMEDLSTCSSYHSLQTANQHSDQSGDAWASFRSGNVSIDTHAESDDGRRRMKLGLVRVSSAPTRAATRNHSGDSTSGTSLVSPPLQSSNGSKQNTTEHLVHHEKESEEDNTARKDHDSVPAIERSAQQTTSSHVNPTSHSVTTPNNPSKRADHTTSSIHKEGYRDLERRSGVQRTKSLDLDALQPMRIQKNAYASMSLSMGGFSDGSSSTLKGGDSLPKIPRRSSTIQDHDQEADDASKVSDDCTRISSDGDVTNISDNSEVSIGSDVDSDLSIETEADEQRQTKVLNRNMNDLSTATELTQQCRTESNPLTNREGRQNPDYTLINSTEDKGRQTMNDASKTQIQPHQQATKTLPNAGRPNEFGSENKTIMEEHGGLGTLAKYTKAPRVTSSPPKEQDSDAKRGKLLLRRLSSSLKNIGRSASFRNSFRRKGKQNSLSNEQRPSIGMAAQAMAATAQADGTIKN